jgi:hypothetical protein
METDWSVAAGADDPVIETGWSDASTGLAWVDLRVDPELQQRRIAMLPEATAAPAMARALTLLNAPESAHGMLLTSKCDRWQLSEDERTDLAETLDEPVAACGYGSYIDVLMAHPMPMADFLLHEEWARSSARRCAALALEDARLELVVRPARKDDVWGYGLTVYCYARSPNLQLADAAWAKAMDQTIPLLIASADAMFASTDELSENEREPT